MLNTIKNDTQTRMAKSIDALRFELTKVRTGRASSALVDNLKVVYYGSDMPLSQVATVSVADARTLTITPLAIRNTQDNRSLALDICKLCTGGMNQKFAPMAATAVATRPGPSPPSKALSVMGNMRRISIGLSGWPMACMVAMPVSGMATAMKQCNQGLPQGVF